MRAVDGSRKGSQSCKRTALTLARHASLERLASACSCAWPCDAFIALSGSSFAARTAATHDKATVRVAVSLSSAAVNTCRRYDCIA